jgi:hypothetical protein
MEQNNSILSKLLNGDSAFSTSGERPQISTNAGENDVQRFFEGSVLDMDGVTPVKYSDKTPEGQSGRI